MDLTYSVPYLTIPVPFAELFVPPLFITYLSDPLTDSSAQLLTRVDNVAMCL